MKRNYKISVAMAAYNGEKFIKEQIDSILCQLCDYDEIIVSDDGSTDKTLKILENYNDSRIKIFKGPKQGIKQNFANAILNCTGKFIFLSDQDDIWENSKIEKILNVFEKEKCTCVVHNNETFDSDSNQIIMESFFKFRNSKPGILKNIIKNSYIGCCMAFSAEMIKYIIPIPNDIQMHDQWIGLQCELKGKSIFIKDKLIKYRRHKNNVSILKHYGLKRMIKNRMMLIWRLISGFGN